MNALSPLTYTVDQALEITNLGRTKLYEEINSGRLPSIKVGKRRLIPAAGLNHWIAGYLKGSGPTSTTSGVDPARSDRT